MKKKITAFFEGEGLRARALRGTLFVGASFGGGNVMRLLSNVILTRLLFPEAFGLMALAQVFITGLQMFSDTGTHMSIMQHKRGDNENFLNMAWTVQVIRGAFLWLMACAIAWPVAQFYDEPMLMQLLPVIGLNALVNGFTTTNVATANRHLRLGLITRIHLTNQVFTLIVMVILAWLTQSVWALVIGGLIGSIAKVLRMRTLLPGIRNQFHWDREIFGELFHFGKYLFLSTVAGFIINHSDRAVLGAYISLSELGVYHIAMTFASIPFALSSGIGSKVVFPLYRMKPPAKSRENQRKIFRVRRILTGCLLLGNLVFALSGIWLIELLYDPRYAGAGPIVVLISLAMVPRIVLTGYGNVLLSNGDSRRHFIQLVTTACVQTVLMIVGASQFGIVGVVLAPAIAPLLLYPMRVRFLNHYKAWDGLHDAVYLILGGLALSFACWVHWDQVGQLF